MHPNPYGEALGALDPMKALAETPRMIKALASQWTPGQWEQSYAPGKWTARQIIAHLTQTELALTTRVRFAASQDGYVAQSFDQDAWIRSTNAPTARRRSTPTSRCGASISRCSRA